MTNNKKLLTNNNYQQIYVPNEIFTNLTNGQEVEQFYGVDCSTTFKPAYWLSDNFAAFSINNPNGTSTKIENGFLVNGIIVKYELKPSNSQNEAFIRFICEMHLPFIGVFMADCNMNANISNNTNFTNFIKSFDYTLTNVAEICLDDFLGKTISGELNLSNKYASLKYIWKR